jgi:CBS domain-containing protein
MRVREIMSDHVVCCTPETNLRDVAKLMAENDCGDIPVIQDVDVRRPVGVITDRDITCRAVAEGRNPLELTAAECMSEWVVTVTPDAMLEDCCRTMERNQVRRLPVVDENGDCCGVVSQADIARVASKTRSGHVLREVSRHTTWASRLDI